jgi:hypothetical protein
MKKSNVFVWKLLTVFLTVVLIIAGCGGGTKIDPEDPNGPYGPGGPGEPENPNGGGGGNFGNFEVTANGSNSRTTTTLTITFYQSVTGLTAADITFTNMSGVTKGTLSGSGKVYTLTISGVDSGGYLYVKVGNFTNTVLIYYSYQAPVQDGIYLGIIKFAGDATGINLGESYEGYSDTPILLNSSLRYRIVSGNLLDSVYQIASAPGTAIYYAVHKALANLTSNEDRLPGNPDSVYMITFTDGLDNASGGQSRASPIESKSFSTTSDYVTYVKNEIATRKINGKGITAYSIGVKGSDVTDNEGFAASLKNIASPGNDKELTNFDDVEETFDEIAEGLLQGSNFTLTTTLLDSGTKVRMTFDVTSTTPADAATSARYIEGTLIASGNNYTFTNITYAGGISSDVATGGSIAGTVSGTTVNFLFKNIIGYDYATDSGKTKQWLQNSGASNWQYNIEYTTGKSDFGNTIIYLVLDCSTSMNYDNIQKIREAVSSFIEKIYYARYGY